MTQLVTEKRILLVGKSPQIPYVLLKIKYYENITFLFLKSYFYEISSRESPVQQIFLESAYQEL